MTCTHCGTSTDASANFCISCGQPARDAPTGLGRPPLITFLAIVQLIIGIVSLLVCALSLNIAVRAFRNDAILPFVTVFVLANIATFSMCCGVGLWNLRRYGLMIQLALAWIGLALFPVGTVVCALLLVRLTKPGMRLLFAGAASRELSAWERAQLRDALEASSARSVVMLVAVMIVVVAIVGVVAALIVGSRPHVAGTEARWPA